MLVFAKAGVVDVGGRDEGSDEERGAWVVIFDRLAPRVVRERDEAVDEEEEELFFEDRSETIVQDDVLMRLISFPNVIVTAHQAFFTQNAMRNIAVTTLKNIKDFEENKELNNLVLPWEKKLPPEGWEYSRP